MAEIAATSQTDRLPIGNLFRKTVRVAASLNAASAADEFIDFRKFGFREIVALDSWMPVGISAVGTKATGTVTFSATNPTETETITVNGIVYTVNAVVATTGAYSVTLSNTEATMAANFLAAINRTGVPGTAYSLYVAAHPDVVASGGAAIITLTARVEGVNGNAITLAAAGGSTTVSAATLTGGTDPVTQGVFKMNTTGTGQTEGAQMGRLGFEFAAAGVAFEVTITGR